MGDEISNNVKKIIKERLNKKKKKLQRKENKNLVHGQKMFLSELV